MDADGVCGRVEAGVGSGLGFWGVGFGCASVQKRVRVRVHLHLTNSIASSCPSPRPSSCPASSFCRVCRSCCSHSGQLRELKKAFNRKHRRKA